MRATLLALVILVASGTVSAQVPGQKASSLWANIVEGTSRAGVQAVTIPYATGGPWAAVPARAIGSSVPTVSNFRIRAWEEEKHACKSSCFRCCAATGWNRG